MSASNGDATMLANMEKLLELLRDPKVAAKAQELVVKSNKESQKIKHVVKRYKTVILNTTCTHCGFVFRRLVRLETKGDSFSYTSYGQVHIVYFKDVLDMMTVYTTTRKCNWCGKFLKTLSREELENRYLNLLDKNDLDMKHPPVRPAVKKEKSTELFVDLEDGIIQENQIVPEFNEEVVEYESV